jgi:hypothetical protein
MRVQSAEELRGRGEEKGTMVGRMASVRPKTSIDKGMEKGAKNVIRFSRIYNHANREQKMALNN